MYKLFKKAKLNQVHAGLCIKFLFTCADLTFVSKFTFSCNSFRNTTRAVKSLLLWPPPHEEKMQHIHI